MVRRQDVDFYRWFSRKELPSLCKKYSLPANRSTLDMAESLVSYLEKNCSNSVGFGIQDSSGAHSRVPASRKRDSFGNELNIARGGCFQGTVVREPDFILGDSTQTQERNGGLIDSECAPSYMRRLNEKGPLDPQLENTMKEVDSNDRPSFEFHVSLEEAGSELSSLEAEAYLSNQTRSPRKTSGSSNISSSELIIDRESTSYSESFKFQYSGGKNCLPVNTEEQDTEYKEISFESTGLNITEGLCTDLGRS
ncbi:unnamed protein product [Brassica napus]|uniref:(rape) hypothetical protein n=1 Tax=Brassica napus TaxID=3708 RepID=A0A816QE57_BRANA|nr:unnamed protein product [Brassica napus]